MPCTCIYAGDAWCMHAALVAACMCMGCACATFTTYGLHMRAAFTTCMSIALTHGLHVSHAPKCVLHALEPRVHKHMVCKCLPYMHAYIHALHILHNTWIAQIYRMHQHMYYIH